MQIFESIDVTKKPTRQKGTILLLEDDDAVLIHIMLEFAALHSDNKRKRKYKAMLDKWDNQLSLY